LRLVRWIVYAAATFAPAEQVTPGGWRLQDLLNGAAFYIGLGALLNIKSAFLNQPIEVAALRTQF